MYKILLISLLFISSLLMANVGDISTVKVKGGVSVDGAGVISNVDTGEFSRFKELNVKIPQESIIKSAYLYVSYMDMEEKDTPGYPSAIIGTTKPYVAVLGPNENTFSIKELNIDKYGNPRVPDYSEVIDTNNDTVGDLEVGVYKIDYKEKINEIYALNSNGIFTLKYYEWGDRISTESGDHPSAEESIRRGTKIDGSTLVVTYEDSNAPFREVKVVIGGAGTYDNENPYVVDSALDCHFDTESTDKSILSTTIIHEINKSWDTNGSVIVNGTDVSMFSAGGADDGDSNWVSNEIWQRSALITSGSFGAGINGVSVGIDGDKILEEDDDELYDISNNLDNTGKLDISLLTRNGSNNPSNDGFLTLSVIQVPIKNDSVCNFGGTDTDNDGLPDSLDLDDDNDGIPDTIENAGPNGGDTDNDGIPDRLELDSDNDGVYDVIEAGGTDSDHDGKINSGDITDSNNNGLDDSVDPDKNGTPLTTPDTDQDGKKDFQDTDDDNDTILTKDEHPDDNDNGDKDDALDTDHNGVPNYLDPDDDGDTILTKNEDPNNNGNLEDDDSDDDGKANYLDKDDDNDGILTKNETPDQNDNGDDEDALDTDEDGTPDYLQKGVDECAKDNLNDCDVNAICTDKLDGFTCACEAGYLGDGKVCTEDVSCNPACGSDAHCINNSCVCDNGFTGDGQVCTDIDECVDNTKNNCDANAICTNNSGGFDCSCKDGYSGNGITCTKDAEDKDSDNDGIADKDDLDDDNDGIPDTVENAGPNNGDTDNDGIPDRLELDSDDDGINDVIEAGGIDSDNDGKIGTGNITDNNNNGLDDSVDTNAGGTSLETPDHDNDGKKDFQDDDDDNDTVLTKDEDLNKNKDYTDDDTDDDGIPNYLDIDDDGDTVLTKDEDPNGDNNPTNDDTDEDTIPNYLDADDDGDNILTKDEDLNHNGNLNDDDSDDDGIPNYLDKDVSDIADGGYYAGNSVLGCDYNQNNNSGIFVMILLFIILTRRKFYSRRK